MDRRRHPLLADLNAMGSGSNESPRPRCLIQPKRKLIHALRHAANPVFGYDETPASDLLREEISQGAQSISEGRLEPCFQLPHAIGDFSLGFDYDFCGRAWRGRAEVRYDVADRKVHFMTNG
jgi:hypothetical protein